MTDTLFDYCPNSIPALACALKPGHRGLCRDKDKTFKWRRVKPSLYKVINGKAVKQR